MYQTESWPHTCPGRELLRKISRINQCWNRFQRDPPVFVLDAFEGDHDGCPDMPDPNALDSGFLSRPLLDHVEPSVVCTALAISRSADTFTSKRDCILSGGRTRNEELNSPKYRSAQLSGIYRVPGTNPPHQSTPRLLWTLRHHMTRCALLGDPGRIRRTSRAGLELLVFSCPMVKASL